MKVLVAVLVALLLSCGINMEKHTVYKITKNGKGTCIYEVGESIFHDSFVAREGAYSIGDSLNKYFKVGAKNNIENDQTITQQTLPCGEDADPNGKATSGSE